MPEEIILAAVSSSPVRTRAIQYDFAAQVGQPDDIAGVVSFLAGPDGGWVNAQVLRANGGFA
jgi:NAD(P)-dependent dehydrogenase (short-subunit alcohol dehydrogenase family)